MSESIARALSRKTTDYPNGGHIALWPQDLNDVAIIANYVGQAATDTYTLYQLIAAIYTQALAVSGGQLGTGMEELKVPLNNFLGPHVFGDSRIVRGYSPKLVNAAYTILPQDIVKMLYATTGTLTWTLLDAADYPDEFAIPLRNRTGVALTIARTNTGNTINGSAANYSMASGTTTQWLFKVGSTAFEIG